jgi:site-specific recombinase XerD
MNDPGGEGRAAGRDRVRWHDNRHTLIIELAASGAGDETVMEIAGHVSWQMLSRYSHIRTETIDEALATITERVRETIED